MSMQTITIESKNKIKINCPNKSKFIELDSFLTLYYSLHGRLNDSTYLSEWIKSNSIEDDFIEVPPLTDIFFYNYGNSALNLKYDDNVIDEVTIDFNMGCG